MKIYHRTTGVELFDTGGANLSGAYMSDANLSGANLSGAYMSGAYMSDANLSGAYMSDANLSGANLSGAYMSDANLRDANLSGANLRDANLRGANLSGANLENTCVFSACLGKHTAYAWGDTIQIRCKEFKQSEWLENFEKIGEENGYSQAEVALYGAFIKLVSKK